MTTEDTPIKPWHVVRRSKLHGNGVFAARKIPAGTRIIESVSYTHLTLPTNREV